MVVKEPLAETVRVDQCAALFGNAQDMVLKADVQGGELHVVEGFGDLLERVVCCELRGGFCCNVPNAEKPMAERVIAFMFDAGFGLFHLQAFGVRGTRHAIQANAFFCRRQIASERQRTVEYIFRRASGFGLAY